MMRLRGAMAVILVGISLTESRSVLAGNEPRKIRRIVVCDDNRDPVTLDPFYELSEKKHTLIQQIMEGLVRFDANAQVVPVLAERWEQVDPRHLRFFLRKNVKFHNGEPFDAESVRFTLQHFIDPATHSPVSGLLSSGSARPSTAILQVFVRRASAPAITPGIGIMP